MLYWCFIDIKCEVFHFSLAKNKSTQSLDPTLHGVVERNQTQQLPKNSTQLNPTQPMDGPMSVSALTTRPVQPEGRRYHTASVNGVAFVRSSGSMQPSSGSCALRRITRRWSIFPSVRLLTCMLASTFSQYWWLVARWMAAWASVDHRYLQPL